MHSNIDFLASARHAGQRKQNAMYCTSAISQFGQQYKLRIAQQQSHLHFILTCTVDRRWAITNTVRPVTRFSIACCTNRSLLVSRADVASSSMMIGESCKSHRQHSLLAVWQLTYLTWLPGMRCLDLTLLWTPFRTTVQIQGSPLIVDYIHVTLKQALVLMLWSFSNSRIK